MDHNKIKGFVVALIIVIAVLIPVTFHEFTKTPISEATYTEIFNLNGFGETLSQKVINYIEDNEDIDITDLKDIDGIGKERLKIIRKEFK